MKKHLVPILLIIVIMLCSVYGIGFLLFNRTGVTDREILISRISVVPFENTKYVVNLKTGDELIQLNSLFGQSQYILYDGECKCIIQVYKYRDYRIILRSDGTVLYSTGEISDDIVPYEEVRPKFEEAMQIRNKFRKRYADLLLQSQ